MSNDEKRLAILAELGRRAEQSGAESKFYQRLTPAIAVLLQEAGMDAVELMALHRALLRYAAMVAYGTIGSPADLHVRTSEDVEGAAGWAWDEACRNAEKLVKTLQEKGVEVPPELVQKTKAAPSDPARRPDEPPVQPVTAHQERPDNLDDVLRMINTPGTRGN